jgi:hypothetical protein
MEDLRLLRTQKRRKEINGAGTDISCKSNWKLSWIQLEVKVTVNRALCIVSVKQKVTNLYLVNY